MTWGSEVWALSGQLLLAAVLGALIGLERERSDHPAGLRTHILVCVGAALFTLVSKQMAGPQFDPGRIAAQIVSGVGFLGAGTILRQGSVIRGLTTAASLWVVAGIGMAVAAGGKLAWLAGVATLLVVFTLTVLSRLDFIRISREGPRSLSLRVAASREAVGALLLGLAERGIALHRVAIRTEEEGTVHQLELVVRLPPGSKEGAISSWMSQQPGVIQAEWE